MPSSSIKNDKQYEAQRDKGMSKQRAARISNAPSSSKSEVRLGGELVPGWHDRTEEEGWPQGR
jgi:hypothetical protein